MVRTLNSSSGYGWRISGCQVQGKGHKKNGIPCQDAIFSKKDEFVSAIALCDGAGSASLSHYGAAAVSKTACDFLCENFEEIIKITNGAEVKIELHNEILQTLMKVSQELECSIKDLACTLLAVAATEDHFIIVHIGDGVIGYLDNVGLKVASSPDNGEFSNQTVFVTSQNAVQSMRMFKGNINEICGFVLMSDGTAQSLYQKRTGVLSGALVRIMQKTNILSENQMNDSLEKSFEEIIIPQTLDDCSMIVMVRTSETIPDIHHMEEMEKLELYGIDALDKRARKKKNRYDKLLCILKSPSDLDEVSRKIHLKPLYTKRHLKRLVDRGLIEKNGSLYSRI